ncbi:unnamed protein product [Rotaria magnacalcarata]|nr:unnamed protein product [Rotaria magnacalcarata]
MIDQKQFTIDIRPNFNETNQVDYESICRFQADLDLEDILVSFIDLKSLNYHEVLIQSLRKCKPSVPTKKKEFPLTHPKIKELKNQLEQKPNCLSETYYLHSLLKEADVKIEDNDGSLVFSYRNTQYFYDYKKNNLSCSNNQGIKILDKKRLDILKYLLKKDALFRESKQTKNELDQGILDKGIIDFLKQTNENSPETNNDQTRRRIDEIYRMIFALENESNQNKNETKEQLERELQNYEQYQLTLRNLENDVEKTKEQIRNLSKNVADDDDSRVMLEIQRFQFESTLNTQEIQSLKEMKKKQYEKTIQWNIFDRNREQQDVDILMKHLRDEKEALNELESKQKLQASLEKRNASIEVTLIPNIKREIDGLQSVKSQHENRIEELKNEEEKLKKEKLEKIRAKRTQDIYKDVGGSDRTIRHNGSDFCPHEKCVDFPNRDYTCHYLGAVREVVDFVSDALEIEKNIDIEAK